MKKIWVKVDPWNKDLATTALENGADALVLPPGYSEQVKSLGRIQTVAEDGDLKMGSEVVYFEIRSQTDEAEIAKLAQTRTVILECQDWSIIPLENLIAQNVDVVAQVDSLEAAQTAFGILEKGVNRILLSISDPLQLKQCLTQVRRDEEPAALQIAKITEVRPVGMGDRVCVDTCTAMGLGEGMLVGNSSNALFLVHAESVENPYVAPRPFRVNAGAVHAYTRVPGGKTRYLSELQSGDGVLVTDYTGRTSMATIGRMKIERRPMMLITADVDGRLISTILQNAETIRLTSPDGQPVSVVQLQPGDPVMVAIEAGARHFGHRIDETIIEK